MAACFIITAFQFSLFSVETYIPRYGFLINFFFFKFISFTGHHNNNNINNKNKSYGFKLHYFYLFADQMSERKIKKKEEIFTLYIRNFWIYLSSTLIQLSVAINMQRKMTKWNRPVRWRCRNNMFRHRHRKKVLPHLKYVWTFHSLHVLLFLNRISLPAGIRVLNEFPDTWRLVTAPVFVFALMLLW